MSKDKCGYNLDDLLVDACESFDNDYGEDIEDYGCDEVIHEIADNSVPIYYYEIGQYAAHNSWLMTQTPETVPNGTAHDQIQANIYEYIVEGLYEHKQEKENEDESK
tara:strand:- start:97 stop:417 length:321 start_codon:yes stop_codon:yes gene_type:complete